MNCPICNIELKIAERREIEIDHCPQCRGVWLDRGELDKIIERSMLVPLEDRRDDDERYEHRSRRDDDERYDHKGRRRKSFLGELFDF